MKYFCLFTLLIGSSLGLDPYHGYSQPDWSLVEGQQPEDGSYEYRRYPASTWVSTDVTGNDFDDVGGIAFWKLYDYIKGKNHDGLHIPMTVPVTTTFRERPCSYCNLTYTMSFYVATASENAPPEPTDPDLVLSTKPQMDVYVRKFGGYAKAKDWRNQAMILDSTLRSHQVSDIDNSTFIAAGYDSPYWLVFRRNEVWLNKITS